MAEAAPGNPRHVCEIETELSDGRAVCLRTIRPSDEARIREGISELSDRSRYLRFFSAFREPPESVVKQLSAVDGHDHIGWGAILLDGLEHPPIGAAHAIRSAEDAASAELSIAILDEYQGYGLAKKLIAALLVDCRDEGIDCIKIQVLGENFRATALARALGAKRDSALVTVENYSLNVREALSAMAHSNSGGCADVLQALEASKDRA
jgi:RimJ/RimL family protein N-acetyltransferase